MLMRRAAGMASNRISDFVVRSFFSLIMENLPGPPIGCDRIFPGSRSIIRDHGCGPKFANTLRVD